MTTLHPDEQARELAKELLFGKFQCAMIDYDKYPLDEVTKKKLAHLTNILEGAFARVRIEEHKLACARCAIVDSPTFDPALMHESLRCERLEQLRQAAGEGTK